jgi:hypothetical protein
MPSFDWDEFFLLPLPGSLKNPACFRDKLYPSPERKPGKLPLPIRPMPGTGQPTVLASTGGELADLPDSTPGQDEHGAMMRERKPALRLRSTLCQTRARDHRNVPSSHAATARLAAGRDQSAQPQNQIPSAPNRCGSKRERSVLPPACHASRVLEPLPTVDLPTGLIKYQLLVASRNFSVSSSASPRSHNFDALPGQS